MLRGLVQLTHRRVDLAHTTGLLARRCRDLLHQVGRLANGGHHLLEQLAGFLGQLHAAGGDFANFLRCHLAALCELAHFSSHHCKALAVFTGTGRFNGSVQCQQIGLRGDVVNDADLLGDLLHGGYRGVHRLTTVGCILGSLGSHAFGDLGVFGVLRNARCHLFNRGRGFFHPGGLFAGGL